MSTAVSAFRRLLQALHPRFGYELAFRLDQELSEFGPVVMRIFGISTYTHDAEDTWEWLEGEGPNRIAVSICRSH